MREELKTRLEAEVTRKQFLQYLAGATLLVLGLGNLISLLGGTKIIEKQILIPTSGTDQSAFGSRRFGL